MKKSLILTCGLLLVASFGLTGQVIARTQFETTVTCDQIQEGQGTALGCTVLLVDGTTEEATPAAKPETRSPGIEAADVPSSGTQAYLFLPILMFDPSTQATFAEEVLDQTNSYRTQNGCTPLALNANLNAAAQRHSDDMASHNFMNHTGSDGSTPWLRIQEAGYSFSAAAENIAAGYTTPEDVVDAWMGSPGHRTNILNCTLTELGVGYSENSGSSYRRYWTQNLGRSR